jgi:hypothetical protein
MSAEFNTSFNKCQKETFLIFWSKIPSVPVEVKFNNPKILKLEEKVKEAAIS